MKFYGSFAYVTCGNGCDSKLQKLLYDDLGQPVDIDWEGLQQIYNNHNSVCSIDSLYVNDGNAYYGDPDKCVGFIVENDPDSGHKYCQY